MSAEAEVPDPPYKSSHRKLSEWERWSGQDSRTGRFLPKFSGATCDWWDCNDPIEARGRRFCTPHRKAHGQRLRGQLRAIVAEHAERTGGLR